MTRRLGYAVLIATAAACAGKSARVQLPPLPAGWTLSGSDSVGAIIGVVMRDDGVPLTNGTVRVLTGLDPASRTITARAIGPDGRFTFTGLVPGPYWIQVGALGFLQQYHQVYTEAAEVDTLIVNSVPLSA